MRLKVLLFLLAITACGYWFQPEIALGQDQLQAADVEETEEIETWSYVGAYFAWYKILLIVLVYLPWMIVSDRINRDLLKWGELLKMPPQLWNPLNVLGFLVGLAVLLVIPIFWIGLPVYITLAFLPPFLYSMVRGAKVKASAALAFQVNPEAANKIEVLPQDEGATVQFTPAGKDDDEQQRAMILARQSPAFVTLKNLIANMLIQRADLVMLDFTPQIVNLRLQVDGAWHPLPPLERSEGDNALASLKYLAGLNPADRRSRQLGSFRCKYFPLDLKTGIEVLSQGVASGERVQIKILRATGKDLSLSQLGLWPDAAEKLVHSLNTKGLVIISSPIRGGLTSTWRSALLAMDRYTRDCVAVIDTTEHETELENLQVRRFEENASPLPVLRTVLLTQPNVLIVPNIVNSESMDRLTYEVTDQGRTIATRIHANSAAEALVRIFSLAKDKKLFAQAVSLVTGQRLLRRLCDNCKQPVAIKPEVVKKMGGTPGENNVIFTPFVPPPPGQLDEKGKPIETPVCQNCQGFGYMGRTAVVEILVINNSIRKALLEQPQVQNIADISKKTGNRDQMQEAYRLVLAGVTSMDEVKRVFQIKK